MEMVENTADSLGLVFEGPSHPYKENLMQIDGRTRKSDASVVTGEVSKSDPKPV